jgi:hypothetical protein
MKCHYCARFEDLIAICMQITVFWSVTPCNSVDTYEVLQEPGAFSFSSPTLKMVATHSFETLKCIYHITQWPHTQMGIISSYRIVYILSQINSIWQLAQWSRVLLQKLIVAYVIKNFSGFHRTRKFITLSTRARHWSLS